MAEISYTTDGYGNWYQRVRKPRCKNRVWFTYRCQGTLGHDGDCWAFSESGDYLHTSPDGGMASRPPGHKDYHKNEPEVMYKLHHMRFYEDSVVTDPELIARLESGKIHDNESISRPVSKEESDRLREEWEQWRKKE